MYLLIFCHCYNYFIFQFFFFELDYRTFFYLTGFEQPSNSRTTSSSNQGNSNPFPDLLSSDQGNGNGQSSSAISVHQNASLPMYMVAQAQSQNTNGSSGNGVYQSTQHFQSEQPSAPVSSIFAFWILILVFYIQFLCYKKSYNSNSNPNAEVVFLTS